MSMRTCLVACLIATSVVVTGPAAFAAGKSKVIASGPLPYDPAIETVKERDFKTRLPMAGPELAKALPQALLQTALEGTPGASGSSEDPASKVSPEAYGTYTVPYTTARAAATTLGVQRFRTEATPVTAYPWRATGKLYFSNGGFNYVCSASMIKKSLVVTAAHCVYEFGTGNSTGWSTNVRFCPALYYAAGTRKPYGCYHARNVYIATTYYNGTDTCTTAGVVCNNDVAVIVLKKKKKKGFLGNRVGWYSYGWNGYSYVTTSVFSQNNVITHITQLGYPAAIDSGLQMIRNDAQGWYSFSGGVKNTMLPSAMTGGSSGGPWLVNFGTRPVVTGSASLGSGNASNVVVGVTSWGWSGSSGVLLNAQGASYFGQNAEFPAADYGGYGAGNIGSLVNSACTANPAFC